MVKDAPERGDPILVRMREDADGEEIEADESKPIRIWYVVSDKQSNDAGRFTACPMTTAQKREVKALLADNGELTRRSRNGNRLRSYVDCQQPWTILFTRDEGPSRVRILPTTGAEVDRLLDEHFQLDGGESSSRLRQGGICWIRVRRKLVPADVGGGNPSPETDVLRSTSSALLWREPHSSAHNLVPALILTHPRYLTPLRPDSAYRFMVVTLTPLRRIEGKTPSSRPVFHANLIVGSKVSLSPIPDILTTYDYAKTLDGRPRIQFLHPDVKSWEYSEDSVKRTLTEVRKRICVTGGEK